MKSFESRDPRALAEHWTDEGEYANHDGLKVHGRESLEKGFTASFARTPEVQAEVQPESLTFLSRDSAIEEGAVTVRRGPAECPTRAHYQAILVREAGRWRFARLEESPAGPETVDDLAWLVGEWKSEVGQGPRSGPRTPGRRTGSF